MTFARAAAAALLLTLGSASLAHAECKLLQIAEFQLDPEFSRPVVDGSINGKPIKVLLDTGAPFSNVDRAAAERAGVPLGQTVLTSNSGRGDETVFQATVRQLKIGNLVKPQMDLVVAGDAERASPFALVLGDDFFAQATVEFDLAHHAVRLFKAEGCASPQLVYWGATYSQADLLATSNEEPTIQAYALVNGKRVLAKLDSGAQVTIINSRIAASVGVQQVEGATGAFDSFAFGDEKIANVKLHVADTVEGGRHAPGDPPAVLVGADFLRAHRVIVDIKDHLVLFSYAGGPVFAQASTPAS